MAKVNDDYMINGGASTVGSIPSKHHIVNVTPITQLIFSDELMWHLNIYVFILLCGCVALFGTVSNVINMVIFLRLGLRDSMGVCLFALSGTDFLMASLITIDRVFPIWNIFFHGEGIDPSAVFYVTLAWVMDGLFLSSGLILTYMSLERCVCVIFPFKVRRLFTKSRSIVAVVFIQVLTASTYIPMYLTQGLGWVDVGVPNGNGTVGYIRRLIVVFSDNRQVVQSVISTYSASLLQIPSLVITLVSVCSMIVGLKTSSKLRQTMTTTAKISETGKEKEDSRLDHKTRTLVKMVLFLALIFLTCSIPRIMAVFSKLIHPEIKEDGRERNLNEFMWQIGRLLASLNASVNIFVYLKINSSYRAKFRELNFICRKNGN